MKPSRVQTPCMYESMCSGRIHIRSRKSLAQLHSSLRRWLWRNPLIRRRESSNMARYADSSSSASASATMRAASAVFVIDGKLIEKAPKWNLGSPSKRARPTRSSSEYGHGAIGCPADRACRTAKSSSRWDLTGCRATSRRLTTEGSTIEPITRNWEVSWARADGDRRCFRQLVSRNTGVGRLTYTVRRCLTRPACTAPSR